MLSGLFLSFCMAAQVCPNGTCSVPSKVITSAPSKTVTKRVAKLRAQEIAETKAHYMARHRKMGHFLMNLGFGEGRFEGVGCSSSPHNVPTCVGSGAVLGDCTVRGSNGMYYRCRIYERSGGSSRYSYRNRRRWRR